MAVVAAAEYQVFYKENDPDSMAFSYEQIRDGIDQYFHDRNEIIITKTTKKGERTLDIRPYIYRFRAYQKEGETGFSMLLSAGSQENIKPELVVQDFFRYFGREYDKYAFQIRRVDVYAEASRKILPAADSCRWIILESGLLRIGSRQMDKETNKRTGSGNTRILITRYQSPRIKKNCLVTGILEGERLMEVHCEDPESLHTGKHLCGPCRKGNAGYTCGLC